MVVYHTTEATNEPQITLFFLQKKHTLKRKMKLEVKSIYGIDDQTGEPG